LMAFAQRYAGPVLVQAAGAAAQFEIIHPSADGTGRTGRALVHAMLRAKGLVTSTTAPVSAGLLKRTDEYFGALASYREGDARPRSEEHTSELQSRENLVCRLLLEKKKHNYRCTHFDNSVLNHSNTIRNF